MCSFLLISHLSQTFSVDKKREWMKLNNTHTHTHTHTLPWSHTDTSNSNLPKLKVFLSVFSLLIFELPSLTVCKKAPIVLNLLVSLLIPLFITNLSPLPIPILPIFSSVQFSSVAQSCLTLCNPMNHSTPGLPVHHQLSEFTQTHIHWVGDAIQPSHPLSSPFPPAPNPSQHQSLFQWVNSSHEVAKLLEFQL